MNSNFEPAPSAFESKVAEKYKAEGFDVILEPKRPDFPFDLGNYRPDLIARKSMNEGYIIEVKRSASQTTIDRYRDIADLVAQHQGWSFLLVTGDDISPNELAKENGELLPWEQMLQRQKQAKRLLTLNETEAAFLAFWGILEAALRRRAQNASIPIERFPTLSLIKHFYSQGELSMEQFDKAKALQEIRNRLVHGYQPPDLVDPVKQLQELVNELIILWKQ